MKSKVILFLLICAFVLLILSTNVFALGITPGRNTLDFKDGLQKDIEATIINSEKTDLDLAISVQGELKGSIFLKQNSVKMSAAEEERKIGFSVNLPSGLAPGLHNAEIVVTQKSGKLANGQVNVGAELAVATQISVFVPYPGKYVEAQILVAGNEKKKNFAVSMINRGTETINKASAVIEIYDSLQKKIKELKTNEISLVPGQKGEAIAAWEVNAPVGKYNAKAIINYDGKEIYVQKDFEVGELLLDLLQIYVKDFKLGGVAKFNMMVKNKWNEPITKAYAEMRVFDKEMSELADVKSATYDIPAGMQTEMNYYWDTKDISEGLYNANVILYYAEKKTQQDLKLDVKQNSIDVIGLGYVISSESAGGGENKGLVTILVIIIGFLVLLNLLWFLVLRKKKMKK